MRKYLKLSKFTVMLPVSMTAFTGYFLHAPVLNPEIFLVTLGVLLQGSAASALNQLQEKAIDRKMKRTKNRPIPTGDISTIQTNIFIFLTLITGSLILYYSGNLLAMILGLFTLLWYNGIYTYFKRISAFAVIPGSLTGALPPVIGWTAAGGDPFAATSLALAFIFFMGQVPHFWLLVIKYGDEYEKAGLPSLKIVFSDKQINRLTFIWTVSSVFSALFLGLFEIIKSPVFKILLLFLAITMIILFKDLLTFRKAMKTGKNHFLFLNLYFLLLMFILILDKIVSS